MLEIREMLNLSPTLLFSLVAAYLLTELFTRGALFRLAWRSLMLCFTLLECAVMDGFRKVIPPKYALIGECVSCGECCKAIYGDPPAFIKNSKLLALYIGYHQIAHNFSVRGRGPKDEVIFSCNHLQSDNRCGIYFWRPFLCRNYPLRPLYTQLNLLPLCSYQTAHREVSRMESRPGLPILNPEVSVYHPNPEPDEGLEYEGTLVEIVPCDHEDSPCPKKAEHQA
ncbi:MAG: YkgJ family cysteine cluster protein [Myxococcota bacterium]|nr:YkgJ family cysteine cluster protein [Myxococcota bacterium]